MGINKESCLHVQMSFSLNSVLRFFLVIALELLYAGMAAPGEGFLVLLLGAPAALQEPTLTWAFSSRGSSNKTQENICLSVLLLRTEWDFCAKALSVSKANTACCDVCVPD